MKITFLGAAHQVTGSRTLVEWKKDHFFLIDYGMEQGENELEQAELPISASAVKYVFLTHAHIDHSGMLPFLYRQGFRGAIYATGETTSLCSIMLADSAQIQETDAAYETKKNLRHGGSEVLPQYTMEDASAVMKLFRSCQYGQIYMIDEGLSVRFTDAGHLLGSAFIEVFMEEGGEQRKMVFSGDVGNLNQPIIQDPQLVDEADYVLIESTYGTRLHEAARPPVPMLTEILQRTFDRGGTVIIPSFAVGRTQELLYYFREIKQNHLLPDYESFPVYVDSPLANEATAVFLQCDQACFDSKTLEIMASGQNPIWFDDLYTTVSSDESKALNTNPASKIIIASGGMCEGGRIRHHLKHNLWDSRNTILFVGYQAAGTLGRIIYDGAQSVKILGEDIDVKAEITLMDSMSGHADRDGLLRWMSGYRKKPSFVFVNHGDDPSCDEFARFLSDHLDIPAAAPYAGSTFDLLKGEWIRLTEPVYKKKTGGNRTADTGKKSTDRPFDDLMKAVAELNDYAETLRGHTNHELKQLTGEIRALIKHPD